MLRAFRVARFASRLLDRCPPRAFPPRSAQWRALASQPLAVPHMGESITEGTVAEWLVDAGQGVAEDQVLVQLETDKIIVDVRAEKTGVLVERTAEEGEIVAVGAQLGLIDYDKSGASSAAPQTEAAPIPAVEPPQPEQPASPEPEPEPVSVPSPQPTQDKSEPIEVLPPGSMTDSGERRVKMTRMRKRIAERLKEAQNTAAMLTTFNEMDMSALIDLRKEFKEAFEKRHGAKLGFMSAFVKACTVALQEQPEVNAFIDGDDIVYRDYVDISVAVSTPKGLVVPAVRGCENMNFATIEKTIVSLGERARSGELTLEEMQGGTFTISNGGVFGSLLSTPILNMPQSAILGMHIIQKRPVVVNDQVVIRPMMYVALSYDHRLIDGREAVTFLRRVKTLIEDPRRLLLEIDI
ncbi:2-oxoglutarate dehydrogenase E2 component [Gracilaria domingensis]|nr:2-oxoglutarate dehydrogenase E2 component [Gracilaria domingensis]